MKIYLRKRVGRLSEKNEKKGIKRMTSLYLAYKQKSSNKLKFEWLSLHIYETPKTNAEKDHNKEILLLAETIKAKRLIEVQTTSHGFFSPVKSKINFLDYFKGLAERKKHDSKGNYRNWTGTFNHLKVYCNGRGYTLEQIDEDFLEGFKEYLTLNIKRNGSGKLNANSAQSYFSKVRAALREAYKKKFIRENPCARVDGMKGQETHRQFLNLEELQKLAITHCDNPLLRKAFIFSALTGLRWSDVKALTWDKIYYGDANGWGISFTQQKTKGAENLPVSEQAIRILGEKQKNSGQIFSDLIYNNRMNEQLQNWVNNAGINKKITYHCARHSFATLQLSMNTDIYTVSKLLGHRHLRTTEIYAKVIDKKKIEAVNSIPDLF